MAVVHVTICHKRASLLRCIGDVVESFIVGVWEWKEVKVMLPLTLIADP